MYGLKHDWVLEPEPRHFVLDDYEGAVPRWCPSCGDHAVLSSLQRLVRDEQLEPEKIVCVSGIGCSSRFPHYMKTYGFHSLHGRALPVAEGVRSRRPDVHVFVITGDGDCCAIGTSHWIHSIRYNMNMTVLLLDNNIYGLTKMQTSPTTNKEEYSNTHPRGALLTAIRPLSVVLGITNVSFVAQTVDWNPPHLEATLNAAHQHQGLSFVRVLQRCPHYNPHVFEGCQKDPSTLLYLQDENGINLPENMANYFPNKEAHDSSDISAARDISSREDYHPIGLFYRNEDAERYDHASIEGLGMGPSEKIEAMNKVLDRFQI